MTTPHGRPTVAFRDLFSHGAIDYAAFRPRYPDALFAAIAERAPGRALAWDCGTGNGQAALGLAPYFRRVIATDASSAQLTRATAHPGVESRLAPAEASGLPAASVDVVTVAQAVHWFDLPAFYAETWRVLAPGGILAVWCYGLIEIAPHADTLVRDLYDHTLGPSWAPERRLVDAGYRTLPFPFAEFALPDLAIEATLTLDALAGYLRTWSAVHRYVEVHGDDPVAPLVRELAPWWGEAGAARPVRWPLAGRAGTMTTP